MRLSITYKVSRYDWEEPRVEVNISYPGDDVKLSCLRKGIRQLDKKLMYLQKNSDELRKNIGEHGKIEIECYG